MPPAQGDGTRFETREQGRCAVADDWARPVVHWEIVARDPERQAAFYRAVFNWQVGEGAVMQIPPGLGGPEPGPAGHIRRGDQPAVVLYVQVRDLHASLDRAQELGAGLVAEPFDVPDGPTLAAVRDPEGNPLVLVQQ
jgi:predicted enzyme related to lactoylglutathione lyase